MKNFIRASLLLGSVGLLAVACSSDDGPLEDGNPGNSGGTATGGNGTGAASSGGASGGSASGGTDTGGGSPGGMGGDIAMGGEGSEYPDDITFGYDPENDLDPEVCADVRIEAEGVPVDLFIILDQSGSMGATSTNGTCPIGDTNTGSRWCNAVTALDGFFTANGTVDTGVAYAEFDSTGCSAFASMDVPFAMIETGDANGHVAALQAALADDDPQGLGTATEGAIRTLIAETSAHVPVGNRQPVAVLITDGQPGSCITSLPTLNQLMIDHFVATGIPTFIIGMTGANGTDLEALAQGAGAALHPDYCLNGAAECSYYSVGGGEPAVFAAALESIRKAAVGCEYAVPQSSVGLSELDSLQVEFTVDSSSAAENLVRVASEAACNNDDEFFIDATVPDAPLVKLCADTCDRRGPQTEVELSLACKGS